METYEDMMCNIYDEVQAEHNAVTSPKHYQLFGGGQDTLALIDDRVTAMNDHPDLGASREDSKAAYYYGNTIKYLMRAFQKNGEEDLRKCRRYLDMLIEYMEPADVES